MKFAQNYTLKICFVFFALSLHSSFAWSMEEDDKRVYTHSHTAPQYIKALYIDENAFLVIEDGKTVREYPAIKLKEDSRYLRLLKGASINYTPNSDSNPNHLMIGIEALFTNSNTQTDHWHCWHLSGREGEIRDFCSTPSNSLYYSQIFRSLNTTLAGEEKPQGIFVGSGTLLIKKGNKVVPHNPHSSFPILEWINHQSISRIDAIGPKYPHSEIEALNALITTIDYAKLFNLQENNRLQALIFKFYSHHDICESCQSAIQEFIPKFQKFLKVQLGMNEITIPVTAIGLVNHCYGKNNYCKKEEEHCKPLKPNTNIKDNGIKAYLKEGINWNSLPQSHYNTCVFAPLGPGEYKPFSGSIPVLKKEGDPALYIYIKQPNIDDLEEHIDPNFRKYLGFPVEDIPERIHCREEKQNEAQGTQGV
ncbi:MAG: hypothetical protein H0X26_04835 [Alphaproteobacteria bacterium]|nr:hypothetical protein [Alphaproteobacteria bacterium]